MPRASCQHSLLSHAAARQLASIGYWRGQAEASLCCEVAVLPWFGTNAPQRSEILATDPSRSLVMPRRSENERKTKKAMQLLSGFYVHFTRLSDPCKRRSDRHMPSADIRRWVLTPLTVVCRECFPELLAFQPVYVSTVIQKLIQALFASPHSFSVTVLTASRQGAEDGVEAASESKPQRAMQVSQCTFRGTSRALERAARRHRGTAAAVAVQCSYHAHRQSCTPLPRSLIGVHILLFELVQKRLSRLGRRSVAGMSAAFHSALSR